VILPHCRRVETSRRIEEVGEVGHSLVRRIQHLAHGRGIQRDFSRHTGFLAALAREEHGEGGSLSRADPHVLGQRSSLLEMGLQCVQCGLQGVRIGDDEAGRALSLWVPIGPLGRAVCSDRPRARGVQILPDGVDTLDELRIVATDHEQLGGA
jgi:hypothetical protein